MPKALLFDVGDVLMENNWVLFDKFAERTGRAIHGRGPYDPNSDPSWQRHIAATLTADEYWNELAVANGFPNRLAMWGELSWALGGDTFNTDALQLVHDARVAGVPVGILTNDLVGSSGRDWVNTRPELAGYDVFVDCTEFGERKPAPGPYLKAIADFGLQPEDVMFLDDTPKCIEGARNVGMVGIQVDPLDRSVAFATARRLVGLPPVRSDARRGVLIEWRSYSCRVETAEP